MKKKDKKRLQYLLVAGIIFMFALQGGYLTSFGLNPITLPALSPLTPLGADDVYFKISVKESLGAYASEDIIVNCYDMSGEFLGSATASSGVATFNGFTVKEGSHVQLQGRQAAPASADGYITPVTEFVVGQGDPADTVSAINVATGSSILWVDNLHDSTEPVWNITTIDNQILTGVAPVDNLTTGDLGISFRISIAEDECWYGAPDFTDMVDGKSYIGGIWLVIASSTDAYTFSQGSARYMYSWQEGSTVYRAFNFDVRLWQDSLRDGDVNVFTTSLYLANGADFDGGANTFTVDVYDMMLDTGSPAFANFIDGGALAPLTGTAYVD